MSIYIYIDVFVKLEKSVLQMPNAFKTISES